MNIGRNNSVSNAVVYFSILDFHKLSGTEFNQEEILENIPFFRREKICQYLRIEDKIRCFYSWKLLERAVQDIFSLDLKEEVIEFNAYGKPFIANKNDIHFNITHSGEVVGCIVDKLPVGIDVEEISLPDISIADNFFSGVENSDLLKLTKSEQVSYFYKVWVLKESYIKARGEGLSIPLDSFAFRIGKELITLESDDRNDWDFALYDIGASARNYQLGCGAQKGRLPRRITEIDYESLKFIM